MKEAGRRWVADFETTCKEDDCRVWAWGACAIDDPNVFVWGTDIESFFEWAKNENNPKVWFHNLKFDMQFCNSYMLRSGFEWSEERATKEKTFSTLITPTGDYYSARIVLGRDRRRKKTLELYDSMKLLNMSVAAIASSFGLSFGKGHLDYKKDRPRGYMPELMELHYINADCKIVAIAMKKMQERGITSMTLGQAALEDFKKRKPSFTSYFVKLPKEVEEDVRQAYKGGFTCLNKEYEEVDTGPGFFLDRNSMYPTMLMQKPLPVGRPVFFKGQHIPTACYPLAIQKVSVSFTLKPGKVAFLRTRNHPKYDRASYMETSEGDLITFTLTTPELELLFENYDVDDIIYQDGWKFAASAHIFDEYIEHWSKVKEEAKESGSKADYFIAKQFLNSLIGKFGGRSSGRQCRPSLDDDGVVIYRALGREERSSLYSPLALFATAYARVDLVKAVQKIREFGFKKHGKDCWVYSDTDSIGVTLPIEDLEDLDKEIELDDSMMGAWKLEKVFTNARFLHAKCYMLVDYSGIPHATVAGMPKELANRLRFDQFHIGWSTESIKDDPEMEKLNTLRPKYVPGGVILQPTVWSIQ